MFTKMKVNKLLKDFNCNRNISVNVFDDSFSFSVEKILTQIIDNNIAKYRNRRQATRECSEVQLFDIVYREIKKELYLDIVKTKEIAMKLKEYEEFKIWFPEIHNDPLVSVEIVSDYLIKEIVKQNNIFSYPVSLFHRSLSDRKRLLEFKSESEMISDMENNIDKIVFFKKNITNHFIDYYFSYIDIEKSFYSKEIKIGNFNFKEIVKNELNLNYKENLYNELIDKVVLVKYTYINEINKYLFDTYQVKKRDQFHFVFNNNGSFNVHLFLKFENNFHFKKDQTKGNVIFNKFGGYYETK